MKKRLLLFLSPLLIVITGCSNKDVSNRYIYLSGKFALKFAAFNDSYYLDTEPAYFKGIPNKVDCINLFDVDNTYAIYNVKIENGKPIGFGNLNISFADKTISDKKIDYFEYICWYDKVYGGAIYQTTDTKIDFINRQYCRAHYWWVRMECWFDEAPFNNKRVILEFQIQEYYNEPEEFDYKVNL